MKLNLLPQTVSKGRALRTAWFLGACIMIVSLVLAIILTGKAHSDLKTADSHVDDEKQGAADAVTTASSADGIVASAADVIRNANLAKAMIDHNDVYPQLYSEILPYVPSFFRVNSIAATPIDATTSRVTLMGTIGSYQQYADLVLALMRYGNAKSISRSGYNYDPTIVPPLTAEDPNGTPRKRDGGTIPDDQIERIAYLERQPRQSGYLNVSNFGDPGDATRGAMPGESLVTIVMTVTKDLQSPDPQATLAAAGSAASGGAPATAGFGGPGGPPPGMGGPGGPPPGAFPPGAVPPGPPAGRGRAPSNANGD